MKRELASKTQFHLFEPNIQDRFHPSNQTLKFHIKLLPLGCSVENCSQYYSFCCCNFSIFCPLLFIYSFIMCKGGGGGGCCCSLRCTWSILILCLIKTRKQQVSIWHSTRQSTCLLKELADHIQHANFICPDYFRAWFSIQGTRCSAWILNTFDWRNTPFVQFYMTLFGQTGSSTNFDLYILVYIIRKNHSHGRQLIW